MAQTGQWTTLHTGSEPEPTVAEAKLRVCVVGAGTRFLSGITIYTYRLANALVQQHKLSTILMRQLLPTRLYPGRQRVGAQLTQLQFEPGIESFDGVDWYWLPSILRALLFLLRQRPQIIIFQWWSGTVFHSYLVLALVARLLGARTVIEFHEVLDTGEARIPLARLYVSLIAPSLIRMAHGFAVHTQDDRALLEQHYPLGDRPVTVLPHGPHDHYQQGAAHQRYREAPETCCNFLYFGVIRPYKGLEDLIRAFDAIPVDQIEQYWLTVVGETWEGWELPSQLIAQSHYHERITFVNRYVHDTEVAGFFAGADVVVLPYHRSAISGPLHVAMGYGLPVVVTAVGGLVETVQGYAGAILIQPADPVILGEALVRAAMLRGQHFAHTHSWQETAATYNHLFATLLHSEQAEGSKVSA